MTYYDEIMKFDNQDELSYKDINDIHIRIDRQTQILKNIFYVLNIKVNLLFIIAFNKREFLIYFDNQIIRIINKRTNNIVVLDHIKNGFYELINCNFDKTFISINRTIAIITKVLFKCKHLIFMTFELIYQRFDYSKTYKLKNLHLHIHEMNRFEISKDFDYDVYDVTKMIKIINKKFRIKITISAARIHIDF